MARVYGTQDAQDRKAQQQLAAQREARAAAAQAASLAERRAEFGQREADRQEAAKARQQTGRQTAVRDLINIRSLQQSRREGSEARKEVERDRDATALYNLQQSGMLSPTWEKTATPMQKMVRDRMLQAAKIDPSQLPEDPKLAAMRQAFAAKGGQAPGQVAPGTAPPPGTPTPAAATPQTGDEAIDRMLMQQAIASLGGGGGAEGQPQNPAMAALQANEAARIQRVEALRGAGPVHYDPNMRANVRTPAQGGDFVVGAPDPSVGAARGSQYAEAPGGGTAFLTPEKGYVELGAPRNAQAAAYRQAWMERNAMTPFKPAALAPGANVTVGPQGEGGLPAGFKQHHVPGEVPFQPDTQVEQTTTPKVGTHGAGSEFATGAETPYGGKPAPYPAGVPPVDRAPTLTPAVAPPGSVYGTDYHGGGAIRNFLREKMGITFAPEVAWDPNDVQKPNAWTVPPSMRGTNAGVNPPLPQTQPQFAPSNLTAPQPQAGPFGHPVAPVAQQPAPPAAPASVAQNPPALPPVRPIRYDQPQVNYFQ